MLVNALNDADDIDLLTDFPETRKPLARLQSLSTFHILLFVQEP